MKIDLPIIMENQLEVVVLAEIVDVAPHLAEIATFAVHHHGLRDWRVTNLETGGFVAKKESRVKCLAWASERLFLRSPSDMEEAYLRWEARLGRKPT